MDRRTFCLSSSSMIAAALPWRGAAAALDVPDSPGLRFAILRHGRRIGVHAIGFGEAGGLIRVETRVHIEVKLAFVRAFHYRHSCTATFDDSRLVELESQTDDNGKRFTVSGRGHGDRIELVGSAGRTVAPAAILTANDFWSRSILDQGQVLNVKHGRLIDARVSPLGAGAAPGGAAGDGFRVKMPNEVVDLWYGEADTCVGLILHTRGERLEFVLDA
jgi:hypothetical protein